MVMNPSPVRERHLVSCAFCSRIRTPDGRWLAVPETVIALFVGNLSHTYCPDCVELHLPLLRSEHGAGV
jgi:hypothetical protein